MVFGPPCPTTLRGVALVRGLVQASLGDHDFIHENEVDGLGRSWQNRSRETCVFFSDCPDRRIVDVVLSGATPAILFAETPPELVRYAMDAMYFPAFDSVRLVTKHLSIFHDIFVRKDFLMIRRTVGSIYDVIEAICATFRLTVSADARREICRRIVGLDASDTPFMPPPDDDFRSSDRIDPASRSLMITTLECFQPMYRHREVGVMEWAPTGFLTTEPAGAPYSGPIELVGPARMLIYGPYLHLPLGRWTATIQIEVGDNQSGNVLVVDVFGGVERQMIKANLPAQGRFEFTMPIVVNDLNAPVEIRFVIAQGAIGGWFNLLGVTVAR